MIGAFSGTTATFFFQKTSSDLATYDVTWVARSSSKTWTDKSPSFNSFLQAARHLLRLRTRKPIQAMLDF